MDPGLDAVASLAGTRESLGSVHLTAAALYALALPDDRGQAFGVSSS
jgi:hypothetical protein